MKKLIFPVMILLYSMGFSQTKYSVQILKSDTQKVYLGTRWQVPDTSVFQKTVGIGISTMTLDSALTVNGGIHATGGLKVDGVATFGTYTGQSSISTVGTIGSGIWQGTQIETTYTKAKVLSATKSGTGIIVSPTIGNVFVRLVKTEIDTVGTVASGIWQGTQIETTYTKAKVLSVDETGTGLIVSPTKGDVKFRLDKANIDTVGTVASGVWNGSSIDTTYTAAKVRKIVAGTNITISPTSGLGDVTINSSAGGGSAGGWTNFTPRVYTTNVGDTVSVRAAAGDTTGTGLGLFNVYGGIWGNSTLNITGAGTFGGTTQITKADGSVLDLRNSADNSAGSNLVVRAQTTGGSKIILNYATSVGDLDFTQADGTTSILKLIESTKAVNASGSLTVAGDIAVNGDDITSDGDLTITPTSNLTLAALGSTHRSASPYSIITSSSKNLNTSSESQASDTSAIYFSFTESTKKPQFFMRDNIGTTIFRLDSVGQWTTSNASSATNIYETIENTAARAINSSVGIRYGLTDNTNDYFILRNRQGSTTDGDVVFELLKPDGSQAWGTIFTGDTHFNHSVDITGTLDISSGNGIINGNIGMGTPIFGTNALNVFALFNATAPTTSPANTVQLYAEDVTGSSELKVRDEAGNITVLSPHNFTRIPGGKSEQMAWSFYSERDGKYVTVDMLRLARMVEELTGQKLVYTGRIDE